MDMFQRGSAVFFTEVVSTPSYYAHFRFGDEAVKMLPEALQRSISRFPQLYNVGLHGPDFFYFYQPLFRTQIGSLGDWFHNLTGAEFFERAVRHLADAPSEGARVYLYGVLCHYVLDSVCHPLIVSATAGKAPGHTELETEFDRELLTRDGKVPAYRQYLGRRFRLTWGECVTVAGFYPPATAYSVRRGFFMMSAVNRLTTMKNRRLLQAILNLGGEYGRQMVMHSRPNHRCTALISQLDALYGEALSRYPDMAEQLTAYIENGTPLGENFCGNFSGEPAKEQQTEERT